MGPMTLENDFSGLNRNGTLSAQTMSRIVNQISSYELDYPGLQGNNVALGDYRDDFTDQVTCHAIVNLTSAGNFAMFFSSAKGSGDGSEGFELRTRSTLGVANFSVDTTSGGRPGAIASTDLLNAGPMWVTGTYDGSDVKIYTNGILEATNSGGSGDIVFGAADAEWRIGERGSVESAIGQNIMFGGLSDTRIYNRAFNAEEVWALYDPKTRWELYEPITRARRFRAPVVAGDIAVLRRRIEGT